jgi:integrase
MASNPSFLFSRGGIYYFRRKIPIALRKHFGADEVRKSLNTRDAQEAQRLVRAEAQRMDELFAKLCAEQRVARGVRPLEISRDAEEGAPAIEALFERWNAQAMRPRTTVYDFAKATRRFVALHPGLSIGGIHTAHVEAFRDALAEEGLSVGTIKKQVGAIAAMLQVAVEDGLIEVNPARGVVIEAARSSRKPRVGFTPDELAAIFASPVYAKGERPVAGAGAAAYWLPLLALYTGARQGEIGQLSVDDVHEAEDVRFLSMLTEHTRPGESHRRPVPIHVDLIKLGFLQFVEMQRRADEHLLFPELRTDNKGKRTGNWSKWFARYLRSTVGIRDRRKTFDSFRHTFAETCRKARVDDSVLELLVGRRTRRTAKQGAVPLETLAAAIGALHFVLDDKREEVDA